MCVYGVVLINILVLQLGPPKQKFLAPPLTPRDVTVVPRHSGKFLYETALSLLHSQIIGSLLLGLSCLL